MSRWKAFSIHFAASLGVFLVLLTLILALWYPGILFRVDGGWTGLRIIIGVDLVLGPLLTLVVFKAGKPGLKFDLSCIACLQLVCLAAGMWVVYQERPLALVMAYDTFYSLARQEFEEKGRDPAILETFPGAFPKYIYVELPANEVGADVANIRGFFVGDPLYIQTEKYRAIPRDPAEAGGVFRRENLVRATVNEQLLQQLPNDCVLSKFISSITNGYVCFDTETGKISQFYGNEFVKPGAEAAY